MSTKMDPKIKEQWVVALRSDTFTQGTGMLANKDRSRHCCLGVLCELAVKAGATDLADSSSDFRTGFQGPGDAAVETSVLPNSVMHWAGLDTENPMINDVPLVGHNDGVASPYHREQFDHPPESFEQIADLIEEHL